MIEKEGYVLITKNRVIIVGFQFSAGSPLDDIAAWVDARIKSDHNARPTSMKARLGYWLIGVANRLIQNGELAEGRRNAPLP